jgi:hypothetical protein
VRREILVLDVNAGDLGGALEPGALAVGGECRFHVLETALERSGHVVDLEADRRVNGIQLPGSDRRCSHRLGLGHVLAPSVCVVYY